MTTRRGFLRGLGALALAPVALKFVEQRVEEPKPLARAADGQITSHFQSTEPTQAQVGDLWMDVGGPTVKYHVFDGRRWNPMNSWPKF